MHSIPPLSCLNRLCKVVLIGIVLGLSSELYGQNSWLESPSQEEFEKKMGGTDIIHAIQTATKIEAVLVKVNERDPANKGWLQWRVREIGDRRLVNPEVSANLQSTLTNRNTYLDGVDLCYFDPGIKLIVYDGDHDPLILLLCLKCSDLCVIRDNKPIGYISFDVGSEKVLRLAWKLFPDDKMFGQFIQDRLREKHAQMEYLRWMDCAPKSIKMSGSMIPRIAHVRDRELIHNALAKEYPGINKRIIALLNWYGAGLGSWVEFPSHEDDAELLLLDFPTVNLIAACQSTKLSEQEKEGAARLFSGEKFILRGMNDAKLIPPALKSMLLEHSLKNTCKDNISRAEKAFAQ